MNQQQTLFDGAGLVARDIDPRSLVGRTDPETSLEAVERFATSGALGKQRQQVLDALREYGPATACELSAASGIDRFVCSRRLPELCLLEKVERLEPRECRVKRSRQTAWKARPE